MKIIQIIILLISFISSSSCQIENTSSKKKEQKKVKALEYDTEEIKTHTLKGDFDGDGKKETLKTKLISSKLKKEIKQINYRKNNYDHLVYTVCDSLKAYLEIQSKSLQSLKINKSCQILGLEKLINLGDIDKNGTDEIAIIISWADWSNMNDCIIYSYCHGKWVEKLSIPIHETSINFEKNEKEEIEGILIKKEEKWIYWIYNDDSGKNEEFVLKINAC